MRYSLTPMDNRRLAVSQKRQQFGSAALEKGLFTKGMEALEKQPLAKLLFLDVAAFNVPKIALSRTWKERMDTATLELSNSSITLISSLALPWLMRMPVRAISDVASDALKKEFKGLEANLAKKKLPTQLARMGVSFGFFFPFAAAFWAAPFARNWLTMKRTHSTNFESMIGFDLKSAKKPKRSLAQEMAYQRNTALGVFGTGVGLGFATLLGFSVAARKVAREATSAFGRKLAARLRDGRPEHLWGKFFNTFDLKGANSNQIKGNVATLTFWGLPAYLGWIHGARSGNERRERMIQSANAIFWFFFASHITSFLWQPAYRRKLGKTLQADARKIMDAKPIQKVQETLAKKASEAPSTEKLLMDLDYAEITEQFKGHNELISKLRALKNWKFAANDLGVPIASLAAVQAFNFHLTEQKIKSAHPTVRAISQGTAQPLSAAASQQTGPVPTFQSQSATMAMSPFAQLSRPDAFVWNPQAALRVKP